MAKKKVLIVDHPKCGLKIHSILSQKREVEIFQAQTLREAREVIVDQDLQLAFIGEQVDGDKGLYFLKKVMEHRPMPIVMMSDSPADHFKMQAFVIGAIDVLDRDEFGRNRNKIAESIVENFDQAQQRLQQKSLVGKWGQPEPRKKRRCSVIAIGSSTGGTEALAAIFKDLPSGLPPIVIAQHMPPDFTTSFALRLDQTSKVHVVEGSHGESLQRGWAYVAPGRKHMEVVRKGNVPSLKIIDDLGDHKYSPSVDVLFDSVANIYGSSTLAIVLTGMGKDGSVGVKKIHQRGGHTLAQDENTSAIYGMPKEAMLSGHCDKELSLFDFAQYIENHCFS